MARHANVTANTPCAAFNPMIVGATEAVVEWEDEEGVTQSVTLSRESGFVDISEVARNILGVGTNINPYNNVSAPTELSKLMTYNGSEIVAVNAAIRRGEIGMNNLFYRDTSRGPFLLMRPFDGQTCSMPVYDGYPFGVCAMYYIGSGSSIQVRYVNAAHNYVLAMDTTDKFSYLISSETDDPLHYASSSDGFTVNFVETCTPADPVYIRWVNRIGGYEYTMFNGYKTYDIDIRRGNRYTFANVEDLEEYTTSGRLPGTVSRTISCGFENLTFEEWNYLIGIALSPTVVIYRNNRWFGVTLANCNPSFSTSAGRGTIDLELELPDEYFEV